jgi:hypothetical protein
MIFFHFFFDVRGKIAGPFCPLDGRLTIGLAIWPGWVFHHSITSFAGLHDGIASPTVVGTAILLHEDTFCSYLDSLTNHGNHPLFTMNFFKSYWINWNLLFLKFAQKKRVTTFRQLTLVFYTKQKYLLIYNLSIRHIFYLSRKFLKLSKTWYVRRHQTPIFKSG